MTNLDSVLKSKHIALLTKVNIIKAMFLSSSHVWMWELVHKDGWVSKNWCFWTVALNTTLLESPIGCKEIKSVNPKGNQPWIFTARPVPEAELPVLWPPAVKSQLIGKDPTHWKRPWCWERLKAKEGTAAEDEMVREHQQLRGQDFEQLWETVGETACFNPWSHRVRHDLVTKQQQRCVYIYSSMSMSMSMRCHVLTRMTIIKNKEHNVDEDIEKFEPSYAAA